ncbi:MAG: hypothetical protein NTW87_32360 [Planctomycetota bacterium]|nr:hypothetical protein [Planctomycetota bacterium]
MSRMTSFVAAVLSVFFGVSLIALGAESNPAGQASEQVPPEAVQGTTAGRGPQKLFQREKKGSTEEATTAETAGEETAAKHEKKEKEKETEQKKDKKEKKEKQEKNGKQEEPKEATPPAATEQPAAAEKAKEAPAPAVMTPAQKAELEARIRFAIRRLATPGWQDAEAELVGVGKAAAPYLIDALGPPEGGEAPVAAFHVGGHTKADSAHATRLRTLPEVCTEVLTEIVKNHTDYKGDVPAVDHKAWQAWWTAHGQSVTFGK